MPTNLPPDYFQIEKRFRDAETVEEKIELLKEMMSVVPKHKGTDHLRADLRRRLAKLNQEAQTRKGTGKRDSAFRIPKAGAGQVAMVGPSGTGKTTLVAVLSGQPIPDPSEPRPTFEPAPGMMPFENIQVQLIDTPPLNREYVEPRLKNLVRKVDVVLVAVDLHQDPIQQIKDTAFILEQFHVAPLHRKDFYPEGKSISFLPFLVLVNKCDHAVDEELYTIFCELTDEVWPCLPVSAFTGRNLERLKQEVYKLLDIIRVYTKTPGKDPDFTTPFAVRRGSTVEDLAGKIHKDFLDKMKSARVWGKAVYDGQMVQRNYILHEGDVVEINL